MRTARQVQGQHGATMRVAAARAQTERNALCHVAAAGWPLFLVQNALADVPSIDSLQGLSYDDAVAPKAAVKVVKTAASTAAQVDLNGVQDATPLIAGLAIGIAIVGATIAFVAKPRGPRVQGVSCKAALQLLEEDPEAQLVDIRPKEDLRETGSPDLREVKKSPINVAYKPKVSPTQSGSQQSTITIGWAERLCRNSKVGKEKPVILLDTDGTVAAAAAKELNMASPDRGVVYTVSGGADAWLAQELPWKEPLKLGINIDSLKAIDISGIAAGTEELVAKYRENPTLVNGGVAAVAVAGASVFLFTEVEAILQVVGVIVALQFLGRKLLFAEDRQRTLNDLKTLIQDKIAAGQAGEDLKRLAEKVLDADSAEAVADRAAQTLPAAAPAAASAAGAAGSTPSASGVLQGKEEAQAWIAAWRDKQQGAKAGAEAVDEEPAAAAAAAAAAENGVSKEDVPENVVSAREWISSFRAKNV